ncbi:hypothetical protein KQI84_05550 [bacterium]|nr:hypothetical protein [bacterium]
MMSRDRVRTYGLFAVLTILANGLFFIVTRQVVGRWFLPLDDAFITFQYARQLAHFQPFIYQPGAAFSTGSTSPLYPLILAPFAAVLSPLAMMSVTLVLSLIWKFLAAVGVFEAARQLARHREPGVLAGVLTCLSGPFTHGATNGLETGMLAALAALALAMVLRTIKRDRLSPMNITGLAILLAALSLSRPEAAIVPIGLLILSFFLRVPRGFRIAILLSLLPGIGYVLLVYAQTGSLSTNTSTAKLLTTHPYQTLPEIVARVGLAMDRTGFGRLGAELALPPLASLAALLALVGFWKRRAILLGLWLLPLLTPFLAVDPTLHDSRYFLGWLPILLLAWSMGAWTLVRWSNRRGRHLLWIALVAAAIGRVVVSLPAKAEEFSHLANEMATMHLPAAQWMDENLPADAIVTVHDAGILAAVGNRTIIDLNGLVTTRFAGVAGSGFGSVWEELERTPYADYPDYVASFPEFTDSRMIGEELAAFPLPRSVWSNGTPLTIWKSGMPWLTLPMEPAIDLPEGWRVVDEIDQADLLSEDVHEYWIESAGAWDFNTNTIVRHLRPRKDSALQMTDGGRIISGHEQFVLQGIAGQPALLILRVYSESGESIVVQIGETEYELEAEAEFNCFQELELELEASALDKTGALPVRIAPHRGNVPVRDAAETYHAWLAQPVEESSDAAKAYTESVAEARANFDLGMADEYDKRWHGWIPIEEGARLFWHDGWAGVEHVEGDSWRWALKNPVGLALPVRRVNGPVTIEVAGFSMSRDERSLPNAAWITIGDWESEHRTFDDTVHQFLQFNVPADVAERVLHPGLNPVKLWFAKAYTPSKIRPGESDDDRPLSMAVRAIRIVGAGWTNTQEMP